MIMEKLGKNFVKIDKNRINKKNKVLKIYSK